MQRGKFITQCRCTAINSLLPSYLPPYFVSRTKNVADRKFETEEAERITGSPVHSAGRQSSGTRLPDQIKLCHYKMDVQTSDVPIPNHPTPGGTVELPRFVCGGSNYLRNNVKLAPSLIVQCEIEDVPVNLRSHCEEREREPAALSSSGPGAAGEP